MLDILAPILRGILSRIYPDNKFSVTVCPVLGKEEQCLHISLPDIDVADESEIGELCSILKCYLEDYKEKMNNFPPQINIVNKSSAISFHIDKTPCAVSAKFSEIQGKVVFITGASKGIGASIVKDLIERGAFVYIGYNSNRAVAKNLVETLHQKFGLRCSEEIKIDVTSEESVSAAARDILKKSGGLDVLISNAGIIKPGTVKSLMLKDFLNVMNVNYVGYFLLVKHFSPIFQLQNAAHGNYFTDIIQINSRAGIDCSPRNSAYGGSKFGGIGLTRSFACELIQDNIKVNAICPGNYYDGELWGNPETGLLVKFLQVGKVPGARTPEDVRRYYEEKTPIKRGVLPGDISKAIIYAIEQNYETGQAIPVTGGQIMLR